MEFLFSFAFLAFKLDGSTSYHDAWVAFHMSLGLVKDILFWRVLSQITSQISPGVDYMRRRHDTVRKAIEFSVCDPQSKMFAIARNKIAKRVIVRDAIPVRE